MSKLSEIEKEHLIGENLSVARRIGRVYYAKFRFVDFEELQSVAYLGLVRAAHYYRSGKGAQFQTFAERTIKHTILCYVDYVSPNKFKTRAQKKHTLVSLDVLKKYPDKNLTPAEIAELTEYHQCNKRLVAKLLGVLTVRELQIIELYYFHELSYEEIAQTLKIKKPTIGGHCQKARDKMRRRFEEIPDVHPYQ